MLQTDNQAVTTLFVSSSAFMDGTPIPREHTGEGADTSPPLSWRGVPKNAQSLALICDDPDAPSLKPWVHWVIFNLPATLSGIVECIPKKPTLDRPAGALQGRNSWVTANLGYRGPMPPPGKAHRYRFHLYALDTMLNLPPGCDREALATAMHGHIVGEGVLTGTYRR